MINMQCCTPTYIYPIIHYAEYGLWDSNSWEPIGSIKSNWIWTVPVIFFAPLFIQLFLFLKSFPAFLCWTVALSYSSFSSFVALSTSVISLSAVFLHPILGLLQSVSSSFHASPPVRVAAVDHASSSSPSSVASSSRKKNNRNCPYPIAFNTSNWFPGVGIP